MTFPFRHLHSRRIPCCNCRVPLPLTYAAPTVLILACAGCRRSSCGDFRELDWAYGGVRRRLRISPTLARIWRGFVNVMCVVVLSRDTAKIMVRFIASYSTHSGRRSRQIQADTGDRRRRSCLCDRYACRGGENRMDRIHPAISVCPVCGHVWRCATPAPAAGRDLDAAPHEHRRVVRSTAGCGMLRFSRRPGY